MQFLNFGNNETFHFFSWVTGSGLINVTALIERAYKKAENPDDDYFPDEDICKIVRDHIADELESLIIEIAPIDRLIWDGPEIGCVVDTVESAWQPILHLALARIDLRVVAEAILIRAGKWAPSKVRLEPI